MADFTDLKKEVQNVIKAMTKVETGSLIDAKGALVDAVTYRQWLRNFKDLLSAAGLTGAFEFFAQVTDAANNHNIIPFAIQNPDDTTTDEYHIALYMAIEDSDELGACFFIRPGDQLAFRFDPDETRRINGLMVQLFNAITVLCKKAVTKDNVCMLPQVYTTPDHDALTENHLLKAAVAFMVLDTYFMSGPGGTKRALKQKITEAVVYLDSLSSLHGLEEARAKLDVAVCNFASIHKKDRAVADEAAVAAMTKKLTVLCDNRGKSDSADYINFKRNVARVADAALQEADSTWPPLNQALREVIKMHMPHVDDAGAAEPEKRDKVVINAYIADAVEKGVEKALAAFRQDAAEASYPPRPADKNHMCGKCGVKGHREKTCKKPRHPKIDEMLAKHRAERTKTRIRNKITGAADGAAADHPVGKAAQNGGYFADLIHGGTQGTEDDGTMGAHEIGEDDEVHYCFYGMSAALPQLVDPDESEDVKVQSDDEEDEEVADFSDFERAFGVRTFKPAEYIVPDLKFTYHYDPDVHFVRIDDGEDESDSSDDDEHKDCEPDPALNVPPTKVEAGPTAPLYTYVGDEGKSGIPSPAPARASAPQPKPPAQGEPTPTQTPPPKPDAPTEAAPQATGTADVEPTPQRPDDAPQFSVMLYTIMIMSALASSGAAWIFSAGLSWAHWCNNPSSVNPIGASVLSVVKNSVLFASSWGLILLAVIITAYSAIIAATKMNCLSAAAWPNVTPGTSVATIQPLPNNAHAPPEGAQWRGASTRWFMLLLACALILQANALGSPFSGITIGGNRTTLASLASDVSEHFLGNLSHTTWSTEVHPFKDDVNYATRMHNMTMAFAATAPQTVANTWIDTGASKTIICDITLLHNLRPCSPEVIHGIGGKHTTVSMGDYWLRVPHVGNFDEKILIKDCLYVPEAKVNLVSVSQMNDTGIGLNFPPYFGSAYLYFKGASGQISVPVPNIGNLFAVPKLLTDQTIFHAKTLTIPELWHHRLGHTNYGKIYEASKISKGFGGPFNPKDFRSPCHECNDANIIKTKTTGPSNTTKTGGWSVDLVDLGANCTSVGGHRYFTVFVSLDTRFVRAYAHKTKDEFPTILQKALAQARTCPKFLRSDSAGEYCTEAVDHILLAKGIDKQFSNAYEQNQNARAETMVHSIGKGIRAQLLSSNLPPEFWAFAGYNWVDIYNRLPHQALDNVSPWSLEMGTQPDFSMFRPFGCRATCFLGKLRATHHKVAPRGEACIYVGLGFAHGSKGWILFCPSTRKVYCTKNALFDETFMPMRVEDQRIRSYNDTTTRTSLLNATFGSIEHAKRIPGEIEEALRTPFAPCERAHAPAPTAAPTVTTDEGPFDHTEADALIHDGDDDDVPQPIPFSDDARVSGGYTPPSGGAPGAPISGGTGTGHVNVSAPQSAPQRSGSAIDGSSNLSPPLPTTPQPNATDIANARAEDLHWEKLGKKSLKQATDVEICDWCSNFGIDLTFVKEFWPKERSAGPWIGQVVGIKKASPPMAIMSFPLPKEHKVSINISTGTHNLRTAIAHTFPNALKLSDTVQTSKPQVAQRKPVTAKGWKGKIAAIATTVGEAVGHDAAAGQLEQIQNAVNYTINNNSHGASLMAYIATAQICGMASAFGVQSAFEELEPKSEKAARLRSDWNRWDDAGKLEIKTLFDFGCFELVDRPQAYDPVPLKYVYKLKVKDGDFTDPIYKARLVMQGNLQYEEEYTCTYAPTARLFSLRTICAIAAQEGLALHKFDLKCAFVTADIDTVQYVHIPGYDLPDGKALLLKKALYGGRSSGALYQRDINKFLLDYGFIANSADPTLYRLQKGDSTILLSLYVDDGACATNDQFFLQEFLDKLGEKYDLSDKGPLNWHLGMRIVQDVEQGLVTLTQTAYIDSVLARFGMSDCNPSVTPMIPHTYLSRDDSPSKADPKVVKYYQQLIGSLMYLSCATRPDISMAVNSCAQFMTNPGPTHIEAAKHVLRYLKGTRTVGLSYGNASDDNANVLFGYVDADHAGDKDDRKSVGGYLMMLNNGPISWSSKKIKVTSLSSFESEWYSASLCGCEVESLRRLLEDLGYAQTSPTVLYEDNAACIFASDPDRPMNARSKHIDTRIYRLRDLVRDGVLLLVKIATGDQLADGLTKALPAPAMAMFRSVMSAPS